MSWFTQNQTYLAARLRLLRAYGTGADPTAEAAEVERLRADMEYPPAIETLAAAFGLDPFAADVLLLAAAPEIGGGLFGGGDQGAPEPSLDMALRTIPGARWDAITPAAPLRAWRMIELQPAGALLHASLRADERMVHALLGLAYVDERLAPFVRMEPAACALADTHARQAQELAARMEASLHDASLDALGKPLYCLSGNDQDGQREIVLTAARTLGLNVFSFRAANLPATPGERHALCRLWEREALLMQAVLHVSLWHDEGASQLALGDFLKGVHGLVIVSARDRLPSAHRPVVQMQVDRPPSPEQDALWRTSLASFGTGLNGAVSRVTAQFDLSAAAIRAASAEVLMKARAGVKAAPVGDTQAVIEPLIWQSCREHARSRLDDLAQRIDARAGWDRLVLPSEQTALLHQIAAQVRRRYRVHNEWGFASTGARGLGTAALFTGSPGTGKTFAAEILANDLQLDLFRVDLSAVVSKYIGETEKHLRRIFDAASESGAVLLFDEADALFGKRSEVRDSHDRYANIEVSYLLQRIESYRGLALLTTNLKQNLDPAFLRRLQFVVHFPFPDLADRAAIWQSVFPAQAPVRELDIASLARLNLPGGAIRNIAMNAAFLAAEEGGSIGMGHLKQAAQHEYHKLEKPLTEAETRGWAQ